MPTGRHDIDGDAQQHREFLREVQEVEERTPRLEIDQEVDVTRRRLIPTSH